MVYDIIEVLRGAVYHSLTKLWLLLEWYGLKVQDAYVVLQPLESDDCFNCDMVEGVTWEWTVSFQIAQ